MTLGKLSLALATIVASLAGASAFDSASAQRGRQSAPRSLLFSVPCIPCGQDGGTGQELLLRSTPQTSSRQSLAQRPSIGLGNQGGGRDDVAGFNLYRAPQASQSLLGATSRPSNRDMRGTPYMGSRGMRGGAGGGGRMNGMGRR